MWGLLSARGQAHTVESIGPAVERIRAMYPTLGCRTMKIKLRREEGVHVAK